VIWLIGNKGMLGSEVAAALTARGVPFVGTDREVDVTDAAALREFCAARGWGGGGRDGGGHGGRGGDHALRWVINCAAYTAVDKAEEEGAEGRDLCRALNAVAPGLIAEQAAALGARTLHISTDYVFDGAGTRPYRPDDPTNPTGVYGLTKRDGERAVLTKDPGAVIIRTAWLYGAYGKNFVTTMLRLMAEREEVRVVNDQWGTPTWARDLAGVLCRVAAPGSGDGESVRPVPPGIYHYTNEGALTWYAFARVIHDHARAMGLLRRDCAVTPCTSAEYPSRVKRPEYSVLDKGKIRDALGLAIPPWEESLAAFLWDLDMAGPRARGSAPS